MQVSSLPLKTRSRTGITLMEVLVSIGILAIGLTSAMSLIPAGKSEAGKALIYDRAATMSLNGLSDAVTFGLTRPDSFVAGNPSAATVVFDPANAISWPAIATSGTVKSSGLFARASDTATADPAVERLFAQARDDIAYKPPATADDLPTNGFVNGIRRFEGRMTSLLAVTEADSGTPPLAPGELATLSIIVFHNRDLVTPTVAASITAAGLVVPSTPLPAGRPLKSVIRPGTVLYYVDTSLTPNRLRFAQLAMAAVDTTAGNAYVSILGRPFPSPPPVAVFFLVDSVGLAEKTVSLEGPSPYGK